MAGNTVPWWRKAVQFVLKSIRLVARGDDRSKLARGATSPSPAGGSETAFQEPVVEKIETGASRELQAEEETALKQDSPKKLESPEKLPEESPKPDPEVTPDPVHAPAEASTSHADAAGEAHVAEEQSASEPNEVIETDETSQPEDAVPSPEEVPESPADMLAEAALGTPAEAGPPQAADEEEIEDVPFSPADILAEAVVEHEEPEPPVTGNIEVPTKAKAEAGPEAVESIVESAVKQEAEQEIEPAEASDESANAGADAEAPEIEAVEAAFDQPIETAAKETAETPLIEGTVGESPADSLEAAETSPGDREPQESVSTAVEHIGVKADSPQLPPKAATAPPQVVKREEGPDTSPVSVHVSQVYEGPLDLLLDLIRKQDIDIYDIPIAKITAQFLAYVDQLKASDMDVAGEFIYTASLLIHIKSKMLLPRAPAGPDDVPEDPRRELVERLLEHERFKNAAQMLQQKQMLESATWTNPGMREFRDDANADAEIAADTTDLVRIFREILERARNRPILDVREDSVTVGQMIQFLTRRLTMEDKPVALRRLLSQTRSERALIAMFLALLELVRLQAILLRQDRQFSEIFIKKNAGFEAFLNQGAARDDWQ